MIKKTVAVAMSGGVDSSVCAHLLKEEGCALLGATMVVYGDFDPGNLSESQKAAVAVCRAMNIPHHFVDLREDFKRLIMDGFAAEYYSGRTPNPCVACNPRIKFGLFMDKCLALGADSFATGHYVRLDKTPDGEFELKRGVDPGKDQSYVLYRLGPGRLSRCMFPLGGRHKSEIFDIARSLHLPVDEKGESNEICFIPDSYVRFLKKNYPGKVSPGPIYHINGHMMGRHKGLIFYTIGQRRKLGIAHPLPLYVLEMDFDRNALVVGYWEDLFRKGMELESLTWTSGSPPQNDRMFCQIRYRHKAAPGSLQLKDGRVVFMFDEKQRAITPGQSAVFYALPGNEKVLGGGIIRRVI